MLFPYARGFLFLLLLFPSGFLSRLCQQVLSMSQLPLLALLLCLFSKDKVLRLELLLVLLKRAVRRLRQRGRLPSAHALHVPVNQRLDSQKTGSFAHGSTAKPHLRK